MARLSDARAVVPRLPPPPARARWAALRALQPHLRDRRFWVVQALVLLATGLHSVFELRDVHAEGGLYVVLLYAVYLVPVIYASLQFGRAGAIPTAVWSGLLALPNVLVWHRGLDRVVEAGQILTIITLAVVISDRVDREVAARREAEAEGAARRRSEARYRSLFDSAGEAILVFDGAGVVQEANAAAGALFAQPPAALRGQPLDALVGATNAARLHRAGDGRAATGEDLRLPGGNGRERWLAPVCSAVPGPEQAPVVQVLLRDVTARRAQQRGLETFARQILQAQEEERRRVARDLHDSSLQRVVLLCRRLDALEAASAGLPAAVGQATHDARELAAAIADELRRFSRDLRPSILDDLGLAPAVRWLVNDLARRTAVHGHVAVAGAERRLPDAVALGLFRIAQEALRNVERHAAAQAVTVTLAYEAGWVRLVVADDGRGLPAAALAATAVSAGHLGLAGLRERARLLGGDARVGAGPDGGTRVEADVPVDPAG